MNWPCLLDEVRIDWGAGIEDEHEIGCVSDDHDSLFPPVLSTALAGVKFGAVAEALLIRAVKCAPDTDVPDLLSRATTEMGLTGLCSASVTADRDSGEEARRTADRRGSLQRSRRPKRATVWHAAAVSGRQ